MMRIFGLVGVLCALAATTARAEVYTYEIPKKFPAVAKLWKESLPEPLQREEWLGDLHGVATPIRTVMIAGKDYLLASVCEPHDCGDHQASILISSDQSRVLGYIQWVQWGTDNKSRYRTSMFVGAFEGKELTCLVKLEQDDNLIVC